MPKVDKKTSCDDLQNYKSDIILLEAVLVMQFSEFSQFVGDSASLAIRTLERAVRPDGHDLGALYVGPVARVGCDPLCLESHRFIN